ncbi:MAG: hypothetical protein MUO91_01605 [candidate division Zixibacteria bacterium]|nr:hypothetical protein [candidate division Zixibacteria bacterium]
MASNLDRYKNDLKRLLALGDLMSIDLAIRSREEKGKLDKKTRELKKEVHGEFENNYQKWYTESCSLIRQTVPARLSEFETLYKGDPRRKGISLMTYTIQDWLMGVRTNVSTATGKKLFDDFAATTMRFQIQLQILKSVEARFESSLFDIRQLAQADLFDSELETARELHKNGFLRPAGVVAGVVLESHLSQVCTNHGATICKKNPTIADYNDLLKNNNVVDVPQWRFIQRLGDLRNLCGHKKNREPTEDEVSELIDGVEKIAKTLY